jgi:hypothetical protein
MDLYNALLNSGHNIHDYPELQHNLHVDENFPSEYNEAVIRFQGELKGILDGG